jgi:NAD-dependent SIR2 family protein deacetylase
MRMNGKLEPGEFPLVPHELIEAAINGNLVVFAGAGVSTESRSVLKTTLYQDIRAEIEAKSTEHLSFPQVMSRFCARPDGRSLLLHRIHNRIRMVRSYSELYLRATSFHHELATIPYIQDIVTTNWDDLFEVECGATPMTTPADYAFCEMPGRKVYKIHGSINNFGSIVVTEDDYDQCYQELKDGVRGQCLRRLLSTCTVLFVGYSFTDGDFSRLYEFLTNHESRLPRAYVVTLNPKVLKRLPSHSMIPIIADATAFLARLKRCLVEHALMLADDRLELNDVHERVRIAHDQLQAMCPVQAYPGVLYTLFYQDGLLHSFERTIENKKSGDYSDQARIRQLMLSYQHARAQSLRSKRYDDVAYIDGFLQGLLYLLADDLERLRLPLYYLMGVGAVEDLAEYLTRLKGGDDLHKTAYTYARRLVKRSKEDDERFHHPPWV